MSRVSRHRLRAHPDGRESFGRLVPLAIVAVSVFFRRRVRANGVAGLESSAAGERAFWR
jgi:hypothetical protein